MGRNVESILEGNLASGSYSISWNADTFKSGVYFCEFRVDGNYYIIGSDRIAEANIKDTFADIKAGLMAEIDEDYNSKVAKINELTEDEFAAQDADVAKIKEDKVKEIK